MSLRPQEIVRSEVEGGLSGPANSMTAESIDCGCGRYRLPQLVKFATRRIFLAILCSIGAIQAAAQAYLFVTSSTIARRFHIDPYVIEWTIVVSEIAPVFLGVVVAYWGDRIHRAAWLGGLTLLQCAAFLTTMTPHLSGGAKVIEEPENMMRMSVYAEESPDLCMKMSSRIISLEDPHQYTTLAILIAVQIVTAMANIAYYALGISYLDDNTKRVHVSVYVGVVLATKIMGCVLGYMMGWGFLRIDAENFTAVESYRDQIGAWWLGWPIFTILLLVPATLMAIFPRKLPSEMVEEAASTILDQSGTLRGSQRIPVKKVGSPDFISSMMRLFTNKILVCNVISAAILITALTNFLVKENIFLESRFYAPKPTGTFLGFNDPLLSRLITTSIKPMIIGLILIIAGLLIARAKPKARSLISYSIVVSVISAVIIFGLAFDNCEKAPIVGAHRGSMSLLRYCNRDCRCSKDADFRPVCDNRGTFTFYSPCHAGCTSVTLDNNSRIYTNCTCIDDLTGLGNNEARDGPCDSDNCQVGWLLYEIFTILVYAAASSTMIGDFLINLRSVNVQDKALTIGYSMSVIGLFSYVLGKIGYDELAKSTCQHWGANKSLCHLHHPKDLGNYLCFLTAALIILSALVKIGVWLLSEDLEIYEPTDDEQPRELQHMSRAQAEPLLQQPPAEPTEEANVNQSIETAGNEVDLNVVTEHKKSSRENGPVVDIADSTAPSGSRLKYGPVGPGDRRFARNQSNPSVQYATTDDDLDSSDGSQVPRTSSISVSYKPLEIDSDVASELSGTVPGSRKRIPSDDLTELSRPPQRIQPPVSNVRFPNPDNYADPKVAQKPRDTSPSLAAPVPLKNNSSSYARKPDDDKPLSASRGDFNELGIPLVESYEASVKGSTHSLRAPAVMMVMQHLDHNPVREIFEEASVMYASKRKVDNEEIEENRKFRLEKLMQPMDYSAVPQRPPSRGQSSSGFGSYQDLREKMRLHSDVSDQDESLSTQSSMSGPHKKGKPICTDL